MKSMMRRTFAAVAAGAILATAGPVLAQGKVLKFVQNGNLTILDPIWTTAYVTRNHGYLIYDTLFASDENNAVKPQMVDKYEVSPDKTVWTFTLRDGLEWHDGKPVTSEDCIASIQRWGKRDAMGLKLMDFVKEFKAVDAKTFQMVLKEPYGLVLELARQAVVQRALHDAEGGRRDRRLQADRQPDRLRPVHLPEERVQARREARLPEEPQVQAAQRGALGPGRRQGGEGRQGRDRRDARRPAAGQRADRRRDRPDRAAAARPDPDPQEGQGRQAGRLEPARPPVHHPLQPCGEAVRQSEDPHGRTSRDAPGGLSQGDGRRGGILQGLLPPPSSAARPTPSTRPTACWSSRTSRRPRRFSRKQATTARRSC